MSNLIPFYLNVSKISKIIYFFKALGKRASC